MYCSKCGKKNADSAAFCRYCASEILPPEDEPSGSDSAAETPTPTESAAPAPATMQAPAAPSPKVESERKKRLGAGWIVLLTLLGVAIVAGITWIAIRLFSGGFPFGNNSARPFLRREKPCIQLPFPP